MVRCMSTILVTGATRGLGRETAGRLIALGHMVFIGARDPATGRHVADELGGRLLVIDVADEKAVQAAAQQLASEVGALDVLVNNAGIAGKQERPSEATVEDMRNVFETNVFGVAQVVKAFTPLLEASAAPVVVNVSSAVGSLTRNADPDSVWSLLAYPMSKAALNMLTIQYAKAYPRWLCQRGDTRSHGDGVHATAGRVVGFGRCRDHRKHGDNRTGTAPTGTFVEQAGTVPW